MKAVRHERRAADRLRIDVRRAQVQVAGEREHADRPDAAGEEAVHVLHPEARVLERAARALGVDLEGGLVGGEAGRVLVGTDHGGLPPDAHARLSANSTTRRLKASRCSRGAWCPACAITSSRAPAMPRASSSAQATGVTPSSAPATTSVGVR